MNLTFDQIKDYQTCELYFKYKNIDEVPEYLNTRTLLAKRYENTIKGVVGYFLYKLQGGEAPSYEALLNRWERMWFAKKDTTAYDLIVGQHETFHGNEVSYSNLAAGNLIKFHDDFSNTRLVPFAIAEPFSVPFFNRAAYLQGELDLVLRDPVKNEFKVVHWSCTKRVRSERDLKQMFAFLKLNFDFTYKNIDPETVSYYIYDLGSKNPGYVGVAPEMELMNDLLVWVERIIEEQTYPNRRDLTTHCKKCSYREPCKEYHVSIRETSSG